MHTELSDLQRLFTAIAFDGEFSLFDILEEATGKHIKTYRKENGEMVENTWIDEAMMKGERAFVSENLSHILMFSLIGITDLTKEIKALKKDDDNKDFFIALPTRIEAIFNLEVLSV